MKNRLVIALSLLLLFSTYKSQKLVLFDIFKIKEINVENNFILKDENIKRTLFYLYNENLVFLKKNNVKDVLEKIDFIDSFELKKIYPNKLKIKIFEKRPIAILHLDKKKYYLDENINLIDYIDLKNYKDLPIVFGNRRSFKILYDDLKKIDFPINTIQNYYLHDSKRWDLETARKIKIKLPSNNYVKSLKNFMIHVDKENFKKYKIFDYRINNQLILK
jgi:cell division septal protein FtsQ